MASGRDQYQGIPDYGEQAPPSNNRLGRFFPGLRRVGADYGTEYLERIKFYFIVYGAAFLAAGAVAILLPLIFAITVSSMVAWILVVGGVAALLYFLLTFGSPGTTSFLLLGILHLGVGLWLLFEPSVRLGSLFVWIVSGWLLLHGILKLLMGYELRNLMLWHSLAATGVASVVIGILTISLFSSYGVWLLGLLFGIDLAVTGLAFLYDSIAALITSRASATRDPLIEGSV